MLADDPLAQVLYIDLTRRSFTINPRPDLFEYGLGGSGVGMDVTIPAAGDTAGVGVNPRQAANTPVIR